MVGSRVRAACLWWLLCLGPAHAEMGVASRQTSFPGPYVAEVVRVIDGDTLEARVALWPGLIAVYAIRVRGIDAPEIRRPACPDEREWGLRAKAQVERLYPPGREIQLRHVQHDVWSGRVLAEVRRWRSDRWLSLADELLQRGLAVEWDATRADVPWCLLAAGGGDLPEVTDD
ncbi:MAG: thermonuclease family protein [Gemmobacter sp.]